MYKGLKNIISRILEIIAEIESYEFYKKNLIDTTEKLYKEYQDGSYSYEEYKKLLQSVLKGKSKKEWIDYYNSYTYSLLKQIEPLFSQIIYSVYRDRSAENLEMAAAKPKKKPHIELAEEKEAEPAPEYDFVEVKRPSMIEKLKKAIKPAEMPAELREAEPESIKGRAAKRRLTDEEIERRRLELSSLAETVRQKKPAVEAHKEKKPSLLSRISDYIFMRSVEKKKKAIEKKIEKAKKPSLFARIYESLGFGHVRAEKARPVTPEKPAREPMLHSLLSKLHLKPGMPEEKRYTKKEELPPLLHPQKPFSRFFSDLSLKIRLGILRMLPARKPSEPAALPSRKKRMFFEALKKAVRPKEKEEMKIVLKPEEDKALRKLVENVDRINREISTLRAKEPGRPLSISIKLMLIRLHFLTRSLFRRRERATIEKPVIAPKKPEEKRKAAPPELPKPPKRAPIFSIAAGIAKSAAGMAVAALKTPYYAVKRIFEFKPYMGPEEEAAKPLPLMEKPRPEMPAAEFKPRVRIAASILAPIKAWYRRRAEEEKRFVGKKTSVPHSLQVEALKKKIVPVFEEEKITPTLLTEEVEKIKGIMEEKKRFEIYQPSYFGSVANTLVRRFTFYIIDKYPSLFKKLYDSLRLANIKVLSNTYVNIMMFSMVLSFIGSLTLFSFFFLFAGNPFFIIIPKALIMSFILSVVVFILFYMYPSIKAKGREKSINTNLPFAINHVSAVAGSGVPPTKMFKLLVESEEYGEVASELGKVVEYVELFGYDLLTAIRSVSLTVPSEALKEFLEGIVSTIESGSEIKDYLKQKASEAMLAYELERQKYLETISTYSDVYTGILIAAPLFFIVALSLVSMLGGTIGGMDINLLIVLGAYVIIPFMNILFIIFIELTQPEV